MLDEAGKFDSDLIEVAVFNVFASQAYIEA